MFAYENVLEREITDICDVHRISNEIGNANYYVAVDQRHPNTFNTVCITSTQL